MGRDKCEVDFCLCAFYIIWFWTVNVLLTWKKYSVLWEIRSYFHFKWDNMVLNSNKTVFSFHILQHDSSAVFSLWYKSWWIFTSNLKIPSSLHTHTLALIPMSPSSHPTMSSLVNEGLHLQASDTSCVPILHQICVPSAESWIQSIKAIIPHTSGI